MCTNSITVTKRNTAKTTIQSTLEYKTEINEAGVKKFQKGWLHGFAKIKREIQLKLQLNQL